MCRSDARWCWPGAAGGPGNLATSPGSLNTVDRWARRAPVTPGSQRRRSASTSYTTGTEKGSGRRGTRGTGGTQWTTVRPCGVGLPQEQGHPPPQRRTEGRTGGARPRCPCDGGDCVVICVGGGGPGHRGILTITGIIVSIGAGPGAQGHRRTGRRGRNVLSRIHLQPAPPCAHHPPSGVVPPTLGGPIEKRCPSDKPHQHLTPFGQYAWRTKGALRALRGT